MPLTQRGGQDDCDCEQCRRRRGGGRSPGVTVDRETARHIEAVERERIACMVERLDNTMMDQAKLAAYIRGEETP